MISERRPAVEPHAMRHDSTTTDLTPALIRVDDVRAGDGSILMREISASRMNGLGEWVEQRVAVYGNNPELTRRLAMALQNLY
jgi:hypothetical protein